MRKLIVVVVVAFDCHNAIVSNRRCVIIFHSSIGCFNQRKMAGGWDSLGLMPELVQACEDDFNWRLPSDVSYRIVLIMESTANLDSNSCHRSHDFFLFG